MHRHLKHLPLIAAVATASSDSFAIPKSGEGLPSASVVDANGTSFDTASVKGRPLLIVYEDKDSGKDNQALKDELAAFAREGDYRDRIALVAVADVSSFNFWPARGFAKDAIRRESARAGTTVYCDWDGVFRERLTLTKGKSNVVLVGKDGKVLYAAHGAMGENARARFFSLLRGELGATK